jgi:hypothetical protein
MADDFPDVTDPQEPAIPSYEADTEATDLEF